MSVPVFKYGTSLILFLVIFTVYSSGQTHDPVLLEVHDREITRDEFLYHFYKNNQVRNQQGVEEYLELFVNFQLKLAQGREDRMDRSIGFINELAEYRLLLAAPYLTHPEKEQDLINEASERFTLEVNASHIVVKLDKGANREDTLKAYAEAIGIRNRILDGEPFEQLALSISGDPEVIRESGKPGYFTAFETEYSFETAVYSMKPGDISMPVRSSYGYHIIRLNDRRKAIGEMKSDDELRELIYEAMDERSQSIEAAFIEDLKMYWNFSENLKALEIIFKLADESVYKGNWVAPSGQSFDEALFTMNGNGVLQKDFISFMSDQEAQFRNLSLRDYILSLYQQFVSERLIRYENFKLEEKYPEFRFQLHEYRDAMLLLAITQKMVWSKIESDNQDLLLKKWEDELHSRYQVKINEAVLSSLFAD